MSRIHTNKKLRGGDSYNGIIPRKLCAVYIFRFRTRICGDVEMVGVDAGNYRKAAGQVANGARPAVGVDVQVEVPEVSKLGDFSGSNVQCYATRLAVQG